MLVRRLFPLHVLTAAALACAAPGATPQTGDSARTAGTTAIEFLAPADSWPFPFSPAVRAGNFLFVSGQVGSVMQNGTPVLVPGGIEEQTRQTLQNIKDILERNGSSMSRVVKCLVMIADMAEWPRMNTVYATFFPGPKPARSALGANGLALGAKVEIECTAAM